MVKNIGVFKDFNDNSIKSVFKTENNEIIEIFEGEISEAKSTFRLKEEHITSVT